MHLNVFSGRARTRWRRLSALPDSLAAARGERMGSDRSERGRKGKGGKERDYRSIGDLFPSTKGNRRPLCLRRYTFNPLADGDGVCPSHSLPNRHPSASQSRRLGSCPPPSHQILATPLLMTSNNLHVTAKLLPLF